MNGKQFLTALESAAFPRWFSGDEEGVSEHLLDTLPSNLLVTLARLAPQYGATTVGETLSRAMTNAYEGKLGRTSPEQALEWVGNARDSLAAWEPGQKIAATYEAEQTAYKAEQAARKVARAEAVARITGGLDEETAMLLGMRGLYEPFDRDFYVKVEDSTTLTGQLRSKAGGDYHLRWAEGEEGWTVTGGHFIPDGDSDRIYNSIN